MPEPTSLFLIATALSATLVRRKESNG
ncbi:PEP-CTERM sorting domain-containing protein [Bythopirellula polymerisocia]